MFHLVLGEGLVLVGTGFAAGAAGTMALKRALDSLLFGITAADPAVLSAAAVLLVGVAVGASSVPARRATRIDPASSLRCD